MSAPCELWGDLSREIEAGEVEAFTHCSTGQFYAGILGRLQAAAAQSPVLCEQLLDAVRETRRAGAANAYRNRRS